MKELKFADDECLEILNQDQYNKARHLLRNPNMEYNGKFPIYFEHANSVTRGSSVGITLNPIDTWTGKPLKMVSIS
jgi:hypothetical protein